MTALLEQIIASGNRRFDPANLHIGDNNIQCADGYTMSVIAGEGCYCTPRPDRYGVLGNAPGDYPGPYSHVEVGFPSARPEPWEKWQPLADGLGDDDRALWLTVYGYVPVELVRELVAAHGGEVTR